jgi:hypothetical protein
MQDERKSHLNHLFIEVEDSEPSIRVRPEIFREIHIFSGPVLGPRIE